MAWKASSSFEFIDGVNLHLTEKQGKTKVSFISGMSHEVTAQHKPGLSKLVENSLYRDFAWLLLNLCYLVLHFSKFSLNSQKKIMIEFFYCNH